MSTLSRRQLIFTFAVAAVTWALLASRPPAAPAQVVISEILALNRTTLLDEDGDSSDWIELLNVSSSATSLEGWYLTDDESVLDLWRLPAVDVPAGGRLVIFASGKDQTDPGGELHTSFRLSGDGEFLALVRPDGRTIEHAFDPGYPPQFEDVSYGLLTDRLELVAGEADALLHMPVDDRLGLDWILSDFLPAADWADARTPVGYAVSDSAPPSGLAGFWPLEGDLLDVTGTNDGIFLGGTPRFGEGPPGAGGSLWFDGLNDYIRIGPGGGIPVFNRPAFSVSLWVRGRPQPDRRVYSEGSSQTSQPVFNLGTDNTGQSGRVDIYIRDEAGNTMVAHRLSQGTAFDGAWHHLAWVDQGGLATLYIDGEADPVDFSYGKREIPLDRASIGAILRDGPSYFFEGDLAGVSVWHRRLEPTEVAALASGASPLDMATAGLRAILQTDIEDAMLDVSSSAYLRIPFAGDDPASWHSLTLSMQYDAGFVAYLNEVEVARSNAPPMPAGNSTATTERSTASILELEDHDITGQRHLLRPGDNLLAVHGLNSDRSDGDFLIRPTLTARRVDASEPRFFTEPTPGEANGEGVTGFLPPPRSSHAHGLYDTPISVELTNDAPGATIRFTLDGSPPTEEGGFLYSGPVPVTTTTVLRAACFRAGSTSAGSMTRSFIFPSEVLHQVRPPDHPTTWAGHRADYGMDPRIVEDPILGARMLPALEELPSLSLVMSFEDLFGPDGIYQNPRQTGAPSERPASLELMRGAGAEGEFQVNCGVRIFGNRSRDPGASPKHGFRFVFKSRYGPAKLRRAFFPGSRVDEFDTFVARPNAFDSWVSGDASQRQGATYLRDEWVRSAHRDTGQPGVHSFLAHLYLNGLYWGVYNVTERPDAAFAAAYLGGDKEDWDSIKTHEEVVDGTIDAYRELDRLAAAGIGTYEDYLAIQEFLDVGNLADYMIVNMFAPSTDWPGNYYMVRRRGGVEGFRFFCWDSEYAFLGGVDNNRTLPHWRDADSPTKFHHALRGLSEYRLKFADRAHRHLTGGGILTPNSVAARWLDLMATIEDGLACESARWGDYRRATPYRPDVEWAAESRYLLDDFFPLRTGIVLDQFRAQGLYPEVAAPRFDHPGGLIDGGHILRITADEGTIHYTLDTTDPREPGGSVSPSATQLSSGSPLEPFVETTHVKARVRAGGAWSALSEAVFVIDGPSPLRITEIMYHPADPPDGSELDADDFEFLEIQNTGPHPLPLTGIRIEGGISFDFARSSLGQLEPGGLAVLVENEEAFVARYPDPTIPIAGTYRGNLSNGGETLRLADHLDRVLLEIDYRDDWIPATDGDGPSLVAVDLLAPLEAWSERSQWRESIFPLGSPGVSEADIELGGWQRPGDTNQDGQLDLSDAVRLLQILFLGAADQIPCGAETLDTGPARDLLDANGDRTVDLSDPVCCLLHLFLGGSEPVLGTDCVLLRGCPDVCID